MNLLEEMVYSLPQEWAAKAYEANSTGMSDCHCESITVIQEYIEFLGNRVRELESVE